MTNEAKRGYTRAKTSIETGVRIFGGVSQVLQAKERVTDIIDGLNVIYSQFSAAFRYLHIQRDIPPYSVQSHPNLKFGDGIVVSVKGQRFTNEQGSVIDESRTGWLTTVFGDSGDSDERKEAGFPPEFLAVDAAGFIYAHNGNSPTRFGGRIFRFDPADETQTSIAREFVGSINYYSTTLQFARPAAPVAMTTGRVRYAGRALETLFIADLEYTGALGVALPTPRAVVKQLPVELLKPGEPYNDGFARNHFVAQEVVSDERWHFSGPTDIAATSDAVTSRIYLSDERSIWVVRHDLSSGASTVQEILHEQGRRWSGLSFDWKEDPNFYFADFETGQLFYVTYNELLLAEQPNHSLREFARPLGSLGPGRVYDIEVDQRQKMMLAATREGITRFPMPAVVRTQPGAFRAGVKRLTRELQSLVALGLDATPFQLLPVSPAEVGNGRVRMVTRSAATSGGAATQESMVKLVPIGPTEVDLR